jgi:signal transduction histidine kinase
MRCAKPLRKRIARGASEIEVKCFERVARRGQRLDESKPGSGLGLSIVLELAALYGGGLTLSNAPIGRLRAELVLPAV